MAARTQALTMTVVTLIAVMAGTTPARTMVVAEPGGGESQARALWRSRRPDRWWFG